MSETEAETMMRTCSTELARRFEELIPDQRALEELGDLQQKVVTAAFLMGAEKVADNWDGWKSERPDDPASFMDEIVRGLWQP